MLKNDQKSEELYFCSYYQATVKREKCWFLTAILRSFEHVAFDRTLNVAESIFEFFVPFRLEQYFLEIVHDMERRQIILHYAKLPNRLQYP